MCVRPFSSPSSLTYRSVQGRKIPLVDDETSLTKKVYREWVADPSPTVFKGERYVSSNDMDGAHLHDPGRLQTRRLGHRSQHPAQAYEKQPRSAVRLLLADRGAEMVVCARCVGKEGLSFKKLGFDLHVDSGEPRFR